MKLTQPFTFPSGVTLKNRVLMAPMTISSSLPNGDVSEEEIAYYSRRAKSGIGAIITACAYVEPLGIGFANSIGVEDDARIPGLQTLATAIQENGAKAILQIFHAGRMSNTNLLKGEQPVSASGVPALRPGSETPREMTNDEIEATIKAFGEATRRAIEAGFDGVEIHGANTYLIQQFFSPHSNLRTDKWGGDVQARMAFPLAVTAAVQAAVKEHAKKPFVVGYRISPEEREEPGITMEDTIQFVEALASNSIDYIHASVGNFFAGSIRDESDKVSRVQLIQDAVGSSVPVIGVGGLQTPAQVEQALDVTPLVSLGHSLIMDPEWYGKATTAKEEEIYPALYRSKEHDLTIPAPLWNMVTGVPGWFNVQD
ncbi:NADH-dependent flavin oxidoreductase [Lysinibacillus contaminans]|uniref:NADH-dependent flavin oxidoreductase n=1 Tax=Lysinibacillus contaminans TaxID=1293441 RepID=A0ABR5K1R6_9BACI|nr:NADH-dependent flavin oxidoreductase [Lysinibacillus contaminans]KOS68671.1 NADH-dependent flavin oxidoreductase [Lysinibacillus contaminans]